jgi:hypothetical protein
MDLPDCHMSAQWPLAAGVGPVLTAYAIRSPLGSDERGVGCPRVVVGDAAQMASGMVSIDLYGSRPYMKITHLIRVTWRKEGSL